MRFLFDFKKKSYPRSTAIRRALSEFNKSLMLTVDLEQLPKNIIGKIKEITQVEKIAIALLDPETGRYPIVESRGYDFENIRSVVFQTDDNLVYWFSVNETHLLLSKSPGVFQYLSKREQAYLKKIKAEVIFPLKAMNRIKGMVFLNRKSTGEDFTNEDIDLLNTLLGPAALALENASLYFEQKSRLRKMYRADRLATLGQLAAGAAHEIRNPLMSIRSTMQYLQDDTKEEANKELMDDLIQEVDRIDGIINDLLSFSKSREPQMESVNLKQLLDQVIGLISTTAKKQQVDLRLLYHQQQTRIKADPGQLKQVFLNILMNALEAIEEKGCIDVTVDLQNISISGIRNRRASYFRLVFKDTGKGIPQEHLEHIFDPFYTTKKEGTGLGLSIAYSIVQQHGREIEIESYTKTERPQGYGTKVTISLPIIQRGEAASEYAGRNG